MTASLSGKHSLSSLHMVPNGPGSLLGIPQHPVQPSSFAGKVTAPTFPSAADDAILRRRSCSPASVAYWASS